MMSEKVDKKEKNEHSNNKHDEKSSITDESSSHVEDTSQNTGHKNDKNVNEDLCTKGNGNKKNGKDQNEKHTNGKKNDKHKNGKQKNGDKHHSSKPKTGKKSRTVIFEEELQKQNSAQLVKKVQDVYGLLKQKTTHIQHQEPIDWTPYKDDQRLSEENVSFINALQNADTKDEEDQLLADSKEVAYSSIVEILECLWSVEEMQKFLILVHDFLAEDESRVEQMNEQTPKVRESFQHLLTSHDEVIRYTASQIITKLIFARSGRPEVQDIQFFLGWLKGGLDLHNDYLQSVAHCLQKLLMVDDYRLAFMEMNGVHRILSLLTNKLKPQIQYQLCFCLWAVTFNPIIAEKVNRTCIIPLLMDVLEWCPAEITKLPRVITGAIRNLLEKPQSNQIRRRNALLFIQCNILPQLDLLETKLQNVDDPEFSEDFKEVREIVQSTVEEASSFEEYDCELRSGLLRWSVVHTEKKFWEENAERLNDNEHELLAILVNFLKESEDSSVLCIAAHDIGEYMKYHPRGKLMVESLGGKDALLKLLNSTNNDVKGFALKSLQVFMLGHHDLFSQLQKSHGNSLTKIGHQDSKEKQ